MYSDDLSKRDVRFNEMVTDYEKIKAQGSKLAQQLHKLNDERLDMIKENQYLKYRVQQIEGTAAGRELARRQSSIPIGLSHRNFKTEDEEGELFSNTYLTDLKEGRMQSYDNFGRQTLPLEEIQKRNSMMLPHMRSAYWTEMLDSKATEDEIRVSYAQIWGKFTKNKKK